MTVVSKYHSECKTKSLLFYFIYRQVSVLMLMKCNNFELANSVFKHNNQFIHVVITKNTVAFLMMERDKDETQLQLGRCATFVEIIVFFLKQDVLITSA